MSEQARSGPGECGGLRPAVFLDRDGTLIHDTHYLADPHRVVLVDGAAQAIGRLRAAGFVVVVVTNQSGIARGRVTLLEYEAVRARLDAMLEAAGAPLDATYMCPHHPDVGGPCECRKPATGLYTRAGREMGLDLRQSVLVGDRWRDVAAAPALGASGILVPGPDTPPDDVERARAAGAATALTLGAAVDRILAR